MPTAESPTPKNRIEEVAETAVTAFALGQPAFGQVCVSNELNRPGIFVSPSGPSPSRAAYLLPSMPPVVRGSNMNPLLLVHRTIAWVKDNLSSLIWLGDERWKAKNCTGTCWA